MQRHFLSPLSFDLPFTRSEEKSKLFASFLQNIEYVDAIKFQSVFLNDIPNVGDLTKTNDSDATSQ